MSFKQKETEGEAHVSEEIAESQQHTESASFDVRVTLNLNVLLKHKFH